MEDLAKLKNFGRIRVSLLEQTKPVRGQFYSHTESAVVYVTDTYKGVHGRRQYIVREISANAMETFKWTDKKTGSGAVIGVVVGGLYGAIVGFAIGVPTLMEREVRRRNRERGQAFYPVQ